MHFIGLPFRWLSRLISGLPWSWRQALGRGLGWLWFDLVRIRRRVVIENIGRAFPQMGESERTQLGRRAMGEFCTNLVEYCQLPFLNDGTATAKFALHGLENLDLALAKKRGVMILTAHIGNGDLGTAALAQRGYRIHLVSKVFKTKWLNDLWFGMRERVGVKFIAPRNSSFAVLKALKKGEVVIFVLDQFTGPPIGVKTTFFGIETGTGVGLAVMAERSGAAVVPAYTYRDHEGTNHVCLEPEIPFVRDQDHDVDLQKMTQVYTDQLEQYIRRHPDQWMWLHRRWKVFKH